MTYYGSTVFQASKVMSHPPRCIAPMFTTTTRTPTSKSRAVTRHHALLLSSPCADSWISQPISVSPRFLPAFLVVCRLRVHPPVSSPSVLDSLDFPLPLAFLLANGVHHYTERKQKRNITGLSPPPSSLSCSSDLVSSDFPPPLAFLLANGVHHYTERKQKH